METSMRIDKIILGALVLGNLACTAEICDDFSANGWTQFKDTPGKLQVQKNKLYLEDSTAAPAWVTAYKTYDIDLDKTPLLVVKVSQLSSKGQIKLVRHNPYAKVSVLVLDKPGTYTVNIKDICRWQGKAQIGVSLYAIGNSASITFSQLKFTDKLSKEDTQEIQAPTVRLTQRRPPFEIVPLFNSCGYYFTTTQKQTLDVWYRKKGDTWHQALKPAWISEENMVRGSIVGLDESTHYDLKIVDGGKTLAVKSFETWSSQVTVAKTIVLDSSNYHGHLAITVKGAPDAWIKYTAAPGFILKNTGKSPLLELSKAEYVLLEGLTLDGGNSSAVIIKDCRNVRMVNCDLSGWGIVGVQRFDKDGKYYTKEGRAINWNGGIFLEKSRNTVIERCYFHDPRNTANSWRYSHPAGPEGIMINSPEATVIRYNDFIGSDEHRWNDAVEGVGNFHKDGGFNRDADIYGNQMMFGNDDGIEIDGGQQNVRVFLNKFEGFLCAVSIQGCMAGPSYLYRNLMVNLGDQFGKAGQIIKTSSNNAGKDAVSFIFNNTLSGNGHSLPLHRLFKIVAKNNIFAAKQGVSGRPVCLKAETDYNLVTAGKTGDEKHGIFGRRPQFDNEMASLYMPKPSCPSVGKGIAIDNFAEGANIDMGAIPQGSDLVLPYRPIPVTLDQYQLNFTIKTGKAAAQTVTAAIGDKNFSSAYKVRQNKAFDWFSVTPASGKLTSGGKVRFSVKLKPELMTRQKSYRGAFLIRLDNGYSRPVTIYAKTDASSPMRPQRNGVVTVYAEAENPSGGLPYSQVKDRDASQGKCVQIPDMDDVQRTTPAEYSFEIPKNGRYFVLMRIKSDAPVGLHDSLKFGLDGADIKAAHLSSATSWTWALAANNGNKRMMYLKMHKLSKGKHVIKILPREAIYLDVVVITDNPKLFEQR
jgi:hypothetical protein